jgi:hypothetical protein
MRMGSPVKKLFLTTVLELDCVHDAVSATL